MIEEIRYTNKADAMAAVIKSGRALKYASEELRADPEVVMAAVKRYGGALEYASDVLKADPEVVMAAVKSYGLALMYASPRICGDKDTVILAVKNNCLALQYASEELRNDKEVILAALWSREYRVCKFVGKRGFLEVLKDAENLKEKISFANVLKASTNEFKSDREVV